MLTGASQAISPRRMCDGFITAAIVALVAVGCDNSASIEPEPPSPVAQATILEKGRAAYDTYCSGCHGVNGDGNGEAAGFLQPRPRDFTTAQFKFSSTRAGRLPTDEDLRRTITFGLKGSSMPKWDLLPLETVDAIIAHIKTFSPKWAARLPAPAIPLVENPYRRLTDRSAAIRRGEAVYHGFATCWTCHPAYVETERINELLGGFGLPARSIFRRVLHQSVAAPDAEGEVAFPPDFTRDLMRAGNGVDDLYRSIAAGITGTAMPTWIDSMDFPSAHEGQPPLVEPSDLWAIAYYVRALIAKRPNKLAPGRIDIRERKQVFHLDGVPPSVVVEDESPANRLGGATTDEFFEEDMTSIDEFHEEDMTPIDEFHEE